MIKGYTADASVSCPFKKKKKKKRTAAYDTIFSCCNISASIVSRDHHRGATHIFPSIFICYAIYKEVMSGFFFIIRERGKLVKWCRGET